MSARCQVDCMQWLQSCRLRNSCVWVFDAAHTPEILKNQHAAKLTVCNNHGADFWEFVCVTCESSIRLSNSASACYVCDMTHSYVWRDSFICVTWLLHMCDMTPSHVWHDSFIRVIWLFHMCDMTPLYARSNSFIRVTWLIHTSDITHTYLSIRLIS